MDGRNKRRIGVRLVALRKPKDAAAQSLAKAPDSGKAAAVNKSRVLGLQSTITAEWMILITSLDAAEFPASKVGDLYRLRWRIEIAFKYLKSGVGLASYIHFYPPGGDPDVAKAHILCHLLTILMTEPLLADHLGVSPRLAAA